MAATGAQIRNNVINGAAGAGIQIGSGSDGIEVTGNVVRNAGEWGVENWDLAAVYLQSSGGDIRNVRIADNLFTDTRDDGSKTMETAVRTRDGIGASAIIIEHNDARGLKKDGGEEKPWFFDTFQADPRIGPTWLVRENVVDTMIASLTLLKPSVAQNPGGQGGVFLRTNAATVEDLLDAWGDGQQVILRFNVNGTSVTHSSTGIVLRNGASVTFQAGDTLTVRREANAWVEWERNA